LIATKITKYLHIKNPRVKKEIIKQQFSSTISSRIHVDLVLTNIGIVEQRCEEPAKTTTNSPATIHNFTCIRAKAYLAASQQQP
jgi:hypothetical protein